jgi:hypothetical protein
MKRIGCRPPYWQMQADIPNCTSNEQLQRLGKKNIDYLSIFFKVFGDNFFCRTKRNKIVGISYLFVNGSVGEESVKHSN